ncbi:MAG: N-acetyl-gamma-glutamyl-phosphate reductase [Candidatus Omnitrophica bacterium CG07_land_8_20_14_0_80_42_15]|uniref:N-acetyl-gamma-glutamyl-phosphate reductase n=1 Tax=Candidatus Aquitaenariimonas noxiae TaxID=1974741 RepID=A0A2J0L112_9BACT|nr:MAG: N-acetyl-gamma-glutamyl-phosphate reductase [Candidatus Omnitrophica bacterium CG07_land_8_20_14_0_80_42_15]
MIRVAIVGATGYTGEELVDILSNHPEVELTSLTAIIDAPTKFSTLYPYFKKRVDLICKELDIDEVSRVSDLVFLALPHKISMEIAPKFLQNGKRVIDMSADYRLEDTDEYKKYYGISHKDTANLKKAVYGLPELYRSKIKDAQLIANPGCYPTSIILATAPVVKEKASALEQIIADSKSGATGAGRKADISLSFGEVDQNLKAYKINEHQHTPEINQEISRLAHKKISVVFVPHLVPMRRGILSTVYIKLNKKPQEADIHELYNKFYEKEYFVRVFEKKTLPQIVSVVNTNFCDIGLKVDGERGMVIVVSVIDNLRKGASGQAVQNMNIMYDFDEKTGLV